MKQHYKRNQNNQDKKEERNKKLNQYLFTYFGQIYLTSRGEISFPIHYNKSDTKRLKEISLQARKENILISIHFSIHTNPQ